MDKLEIDIALAKRILEYLASRPYREVFELILAIQASEPAPGAKAE
jgi:hypothetical protein